MKQVFRISRYPGVVVFAIAGISVVIVAYSSVNLLGMSMANLRFLREHGLVAVTSGGLVQLAEIVLNGMVALAFFIVYKICETELLLRYRRWQDR